MIEAFRIGVALSMESNAAGVLGVLASRLTGVHAQVGQLQGGFNRLHLAIAGVAGIMGGVGLLGAYTKLVEKGAELVHQQKLMQVAGMSTAEVARATAKSWELTQRYQNVGVVEVAKIIGETRLPYGSSDTAIRMAEPAVQFTSLMKSVLGKEKGGGAAEQMFELVRSGEMRNISLDPKRMTGFYNDAAKVVEAFHGKVDPKAFFQFLKYARTNAPYLSERFVTQIAPSLMLEMGDSSAGTALTSFSQAIVGGKMTKRAAQALAGLGLIDPSKVLKTTTTGTQLAPGAVKNWQLAASNPDLWAQQVLMPAMIASGAKTDVQQRLLFAALFGNRNAETFANVVGTQSTRIDKDAAMIRGAHGLAGADEMLKNDPIARVQALATQLNNLMIALGAPNVAAAVRVVGNVTDGIARMAAFVSRHPGAAKAAGQLAVVVGVVMTALGAVAVGAAAFAAITLGGVPAAITALVVGLVSAAGTLIALNWPTVVAVANSFGHVVMEVVRGLMEAAAFASNPLGYAVSHFGPGSKPPTVNPGPPPRQAPTIVAGDVLMDSHKVGKHIARLWDIQTHRPMVGTSSFDPTRAPAHPAQGYRPQ